MMKYLHTMVRVSDPAASLRFYRDTLGLQELRRMDCEKGRYTLIFLAAPGDEQAQVELTYNWDPEEYGIGRAFGHLAYQVDDIYAACQRGEGSAFCSGMDLDELLSRREETADPEEKVLEVFRQVERCRHPTIAMVQGDAFAGGCELALHCDLRVAAAEARFAMPLARIGILLPFPLVQKLVEIVGAAATREILLTGRPITAARAREMGMVHRVVPRLELEAAVRELGRGLADNAPLSLRGLKASITRAAGLRGAGDHADLDALVRDVRRSADAAEGIRAVLEKRRPEFTGE